MTTTRTPEEEVRLGRRKILYTRLWWLAFHGFDYVWLVYSGTWAAYFRHGGDMDVAGSTAFATLGLLNLLLYVRLQCSSPGFVPEAPADAPDSFDTDILLLERGLDQTTLDAASGMELHYCRRCRVHQPLRAKHCTDCGRCIEQYDHHCVCAGVCVGRDNHRIFVGYVMVQLLEGLAAMDMAITGFSMQDSIEAWIATNLPYIVIYISSLFTVLMALPLSCYHVYLVLSNQTSWEHARRSHITYLRDLPTDASPFSRGCLRNCWEFVTGGVRNTWTGPTARELAEDDSDDDKAGHIA
ncbi:palmitoyltransferase [Achlya hypogyna]|uniref:Palmitoyltransferase n=1 Tax=Achlya hypogyna TaxID=1202772 RepID=A0A1V9ZSS1_ACHHY|nr:palmitoyltransferase [Achlya hypogyna]